MLKNDKDIHINAEMTATLQSSKLKNELNRWRNSLKVESEQSSDITNFDIIDIINDKILELENEVKVYCYIAIIAKENRRKIDGIK